MHPAISGNIVVWTDDRNSHSGVSGYDLSTKSTIDIAEWGNFPAISGNIVVWHDMRVAGHPDNIYGYDLSTHTDFAICTTSPGSSTSTGGLRRHGSLDRLPQQRD